MSLRTAQPLTQMTPLVQGCESPNLLSTAGLAHMLEHEAFKGTRRVGTLDWNEEASLLDAQDQGMYHNS